MSRRQGHSWGWTLPLQLNSAGLEKVDVQAYTSSGLLRVGLYIAWNVKFNHSRPSTYQYIPVHTGSNYVSSSMYVYVCKLLRYEMSLIPCYSSRRGMDIESLIHREHCDCGQQVYISQPRTDRLAPLGAHHCWDGDEFP